jgi:hypothetical protein
MTTTTTTTTPASYLATFSRTSKDHSPPTFPVPRDDENTATHDLPVPSTHSLSYETPSGLGRLKSCQKSRDTRPVAPTRATNDTTGFDKTRNNCCTYHPDDGCTCHPDGICTSEHYDDNDSSSNIDRYYGQNTYRDR